MNNKIQNYVYCDVELLMFVAFSLYLFVSCIWIVFFFLYNAALETIAVVAFNMYCMGCYLFVTLEFVSVSTLVLLVIFFFSILSVSFSYFYFI